MPTPQIRQILTQYRADVAQELTGNILPFYPNHMIDHAHGGFVGRIANDLTVAPRAPKGLIQVSRILWTFAHAARITHDPAYLAMAERALADLAVHFWDKKAGGFFWTVDYRGRPVKRFKMVYGQAFGLYGLAEHFLATGNAQSLDRAVALFHLLEEHTVDPVQGGYWEACSQGWMPDASLAVDTVDQPVAKSMNTHLHMLEAYTTLLLAWPSDEVRARLRALIRLTIDHIIDPVSGHFRLHFDTEWRSLNQHVSYGHDIEGSWLLVEAAELLGDPALLAEAKTVGRHMAQVALAEGLDEDGGLFNEGGPDGVPSLNSPKEWWPQAEAMVGFFNAYQLTGDSHFLDASLAVWRYTQRAIVDHEHGEWFWGVTPTGAPLAKDKSGPWKAPYHNGRACMELMHRIDALLAA